MKINFNKIKLQNFLSYQEEQTFDFDGNLTLITAKNGSGKTSISDALFYVLFGKNIRSKKLNDLININIGKKLKVELEFNIDEDKYKIIRGIKPNIFEIYENDKLIDMNGSIKEYQKQLENILQFDELVFTQLLYLGANVTNSKNFMELNSKEKEDVFQILMDTSYFNELNVKGKEYKKHLKNNIDKIIFQLDNNKKDLEYLINVLEEDKKHNEIVQNQKDELINKYKEDIHVLKDDLNHYNLNLEELKNKLKIEKDKYSTLEESFNKELEKLKNSIKDKISILKNEINKKDILIKDIQNKLQDKKINIKNYQKAEKEKIICDNCGNEIKQHFDFDYQEEIKIAKQLAKEYEDLQNEKNKLNDKISEIKNEALKEKSKIQNKFNINNLKNNIDNLEKEIERNKKHIIKTNENIKNKESDIEHLDNMKLRNIDENPIKLKKDNISKLEKDLIKTKEKINLIDEFLEIISDDNLKGQFIEKHLPLLNYHINNYIIKFGLPYNFVLDKKFRETILYKDSELNFGQLSNGQKMRIIIAILFAFLKLSEEKSKVSFNILILDEFINGSLDNDGIDDILKILSKFDNKNIILITHNDDIKNSEIFDKIVKIEKTEKGSKIL